MNKWIFASRLKLWRKRNNMTQLQVAELIGVSKASVSAYEKEIRAPELDTIARIAELFDISVDYLMGLTDIPKVNTVFVTESLDELIDIVKGLSKEQIDLIIKCLRETLSKNK